MKRKLNQIITVVAIATLVAGSLSGCATSQTKASSTNVSINTEGTNTDSTLAQDGTTSPDLQAGENVGEPDGVGGHKGGPDGKRGLGGPGRKGPGGQGGPGGAQVDTSSIKQKWTDVAYADKSEAQKLDIYLPNEGTGPFPVIVAIHGGAFEGGDKASELGYLQDALDRGYAVVSVNYRLSGEALFPAQINDVKAAIRFIKANADKYKLNANKVTTWGGSAGGNLAALAGTTGGVKELEDLTLGNADQSSGVQAVVDWSGPINFLTMDEQWTKSGIQGQIHNTADSPESRLIGKDITLAPEIVKQTNPETYITKDDPAFFIQHGTADVLIPTQQSIDFSEKLTKVLGKDKVVYESLEGAGHGDAAFTTAENIKKTLDFLDQYLK